MKGDFTRTTFDPRKHYSRVLSQQGRVTVDADPNEQTEILLHYLRTLAADLIGPCAAPFTGGGFELALGSSDLMISRGRYYVDGILVENEADCSYASQPDYPLPPGDALAASIAKQGGNAFWVYLDVWERHITYIDDNRIRDVALGGPDTCTRAKVVWQVKAQVVDETTADRLEAGASRRAELKKLEAALLGRLDAVAPANRGAALKQLDEIHRQMDQLNAPACLAPVSALTPLSEAALTARVDPGFQSDDPCVLSPSAKYRGHENHLYRVEIHQGSDTGAPTFKWSRDNGSVASAWLATNGNDIQVASGRGFAGASWVELIDDTRELLGVPGLLVRIAKVEGATLTVESTPGLAPDALVWSSAMLNPKVRRWDQVQKGDSILLAGAVPIVESGGATEHWIDLEDGIQVRFETGGEYRTGDYWLIPARVATGQLDWPEIAGVAQPSPPHGILHHYAPLGFLSWQNDGPSVDPHCRCVFEPVSTCFIPEPEIAADRLPARPRKSQNPAAPAKPVRNPTAPTPSPRRAKVAKKPRRAPG